MHELDGVYTVHTEPTRVLMSHSMIGTRLSLEPVALSKRFLAWRNRKYLQKGGNSRKPIQLQFLNNLYIYLYCTSSPGYNTLFLYINIPFSCPPLLSPNFPLYSRLSFRIKVEWLMNSLQEFKDKAVAVQNIGLTLPRDPKENQIFIRILESLLDQFNVVRIRKKYMPFCYPTEFCC